ncbi:MAG: TraR/DksA family transcriptional regulator [Acidobacteriaceae bacterium]|nr:TraR/DksA family transcriptional regulator [Acidobacteriaceae bacterium]
MLRADEYWPVLEAKRRELLSGSSAREEILIEAAADEFDRLQHQLNREVAIRKLDRESALLKHVEAALTRIEEDVFGVCLRCEEDIPQKRLNAVRWAAYCVSCQEEVDDCQRADDDSTHSRAAA